MAYLGAGVRMPIDAFGKPFHEWCDDHNAHQKKHELYPVMLREYGERSNLLQLCIRRKMTVDVITGASLEATFALHRALLLPERYAHVQAWGLTKIQKINWLATHGWGIYVDDDEETRELTKELTTWKVLNPDECVHLFSQLEPTHVSTASLRRLVNLSS